MPMLTIRISEEVLGELTALAEEQQIPVSTLARSCVVSMLSKERLAQQRAQDLLQVLEKDEKLRYRLRRLLLFSDDPK